MNVSAPLYMKIKSVNFLWSKQIAKIIAKMSYLLHEQRQA